MSVRQFHLLLSISISEYVENPQINQIPNALQFCSHASLWGYRSYRAAFLLCRKRREYREGRDVVAYVKLGRTTHRAESVYFVASKALRASRRALRVAAGYIVL